MEIRSLREQSEKYRSEILVIKSSSESGTATIRFELESAKSENARLTQVIEALRVEIENLKRSNSEVCFTDINFINDESINAPMNSQWFNLDYIIVFVILY